MSKIGLKVRIEAAIAHQEKLHESCLKDGSYLDSEGMLTHRGIANLLSFLIGRPQVGRPRWTAKDLGLPEEEEK